MKHQIQNRIRTPDNQYYFQNGKKRSNNKNSKADDQYWQERLGLYNQLWQQYFCEVYSEANVIFSTSDHIMVIYKNAPNIRISHVLSDESNQVALSTMVGYTK